MSDPVDPSQSSSAAAEPKTYPDCYEGNWNNYKVHVAAPGMGPAPFEPSEHLGQPGDSPPPSTVGNAHASGKSGPGACRGLFLKACLRPDDGKDLEKKDLDNSDTEYHPLFGSSFDKGVESDSGNHMITLDGGQDIILSNSSVIRPLFAHFRPSKPASDTDATKRDSTGVYELHDVFYHNFPTNDAWQEPSASTIEPSTAHHHTRPASPEKQPESRFPMFGSLSPMKSEAPVGSSDEPIRGPISPSDFHAPSSSSEVQDYQDTPEAAGHTSPDRRPPAYLCPETLEILKHRGLLAERVLHQMKERSQSIRECLPSAQPEGTKGLELVEAALPEVKVGQQDAFRTYAEMIQTGGNPIHGMDLPSAHRDFETTAEDVVELQSRCMALWTNVFSTLLPEDKSHQLPERSIPPLDQATSPLHPKDRNPGRGEHPSQGNAPNTSQGSHASKSILSRFPGQLIQDKVFLRPESKEASSNQFSLMSVTGEHKFEISGRPWAMECLKDDETQLPTTHIRGPLGPDNRHAVVHFLRNHENSG